MGDIGGDDIRACQKGSSHHVRGGCFQDSGIVMAMCVSISLGCFLVVFSTHGILSFDPSYILQQVSSRNQLQYNSSMCGDLGLARPKPGPFGTVRASRTTPTVIPDESSNPRLAKLLREISVNREVMVAVANSHVMDKLEVWFNNIKRVGVTNYLVVALDVQVEKFCSQNGVPVYKPGPNKEFDSIGKMKRSPAVSGLKFQVLREFLVLGYGVLLSDADVVILRNPFDHIYRDSDVESMTDGHDNYTSYGFIDVFDDPSFGWSRIVHSTRLWVFNSGFFYLRPTEAAIELMDRVTARLRLDPNLWDQDVFNEELFFPSRPGYDGLQASKRTMDYYLFMNSKVLFKYVRKDPKLLAELRPVIIHVNYHPDKLVRMKAVVEFYVNGNKEALMPFRDGTRRH
ncbi:hypothetical protein MLD38_001791 [Melastoma candidum]|uniref:Uncharacterized protein n=1 Tax=Melastoma candidum TaxID=119954 RepID=A0ACB9SE96_9MYRT|nr:hypothetical protein MLD38_001791 [Melastoma candidum]